MTAVMRDILDLVFVIIGFIAGVLLVTWGQSADIEDKL